jgi:hypothetical protein
MTSETKEIKVYRKLLEKGKVVSYDKFLWLVAKEEAGL